MLWLQNRRKTKAVTAAMVTAAAAWAAWAGWICNERASASYFALTRIFPGASYTRKPRASGAFFWWCVSSHHLNSERVRRHTTPEVKYPLMRLTHRGVKVLIAPF